MGYELVEVTTAGDWASFHTIRRIELFEAKGRFGIYNDQHPDDYAAFAHPYLLKRDHRPIGTTRLDERGDGSGVCRLVAITANEQGNGHGRAMGLMVEVRARALGLHTLYVNAADTAIGFYHATGWRNHVWDASELVGIAAAATQMRKQL